MQQNRFVRILKNVLALLLGQVTTNVLSLLMVIYVPRRIGPNAMGELAVATILTSLVTTFLELGMDTLLIRDIAREHERAADLMGAALVIRMLTALPSLLLIAGIVVVIGYTPETRILIFIGSVGMVINMLGSPFQSGFQAFERMKYNSLGIVISEVITACASVAVVLAGGGVILLSFVSLSASLVVLFLSIRWWTSLGGVHLHFDPKLIRYLVVGGLPFWATGLFFNFYLYIDSFMLSVMTNDAVMGWYSVSARLFGLLLFIPSILGTALFPALARAYKHAPREMVKMARRSFNLITCLSLPIAVGGMLLTKPIILTLYGLSFGSAIPVLTVLSAMAVPTYLDIIIYQFLLAAGRQGAWSKVMAGACVINPLMNLALITFYQHKYQNGAYGAALALFLTEGMMAVVGVALLPRGILGWNNVVSIAKSTAAAGLMALSVWYTQNYFLPIPIAIGGVVYVGAVLLLGVLPREDFAMFQIFAAKILRKVGINRGLSQAEANAT